MFLILEKNVVHVGEVSVQYYLISFVSPDTYRDFCHYYRTTHITTQAPLMNFAHSALTYVTCLPAIFYWPGLCSLTHSCGDGMGHQYGRIISVQGSVERWENGFVSYYLYQCLS